VFYWSLYSTGPAIGTLWTKRTIKQCKTTVLVSVLLIHFKNSVYPGLVALLNEPLVKVVKLVKQCFRACIGLYSVLVLSRRSLVDH